METLYPDIPRIYTAIAEWAACMIYIILLEKRICGRRLTTLCIGFLAAQCLLLHLTGNVPTFLWIPCMLLAVIFMFGYLYGSCNITKKAAVYCGVRAFLLAELAASLEWQLHCYLIYFHGFDVWWLRLLLLAGTYSLVFGIGWYVEKRVIKQSDFAELSKRELWSAVTIAGAAFAFSNMSFIYQGSPFSSRFIADIYNIRTLVDFGGLAILYAYQSRVSELYAERELNAINTMFKSQYEQYRYYQESVEMINIKYHDLKHQIAGLRGTPDAAKQSNWLDVMEEEVNQYQTFRRTGNQVLDTILSIKQWYCKKHDINLTCVADGDILKAIHVMDLCSIFGNALDNAIESVVLLEQREQRLIHLSVSQQKSFIFILIENYCENDIELTDGLPLTTKADKKSHGFGMKSMRYSVLKYGGSLSVAVEDNWFKLKILIPYN